MGWFIINTTIFAFLNLPDSHNRYPEDLLLLWILVLLGNLIVLTVLIILKQTRWVALGIISALALNYVIAIVFLSATDANCFMPVTYPVYNTKAPTRTSTPPG